MLKRATLPCLGGIGRCVLVCAALHADGHEQADGLLALLHEAALLAPCVEAGDGRQRQALVQQLQRGQQLIADAVVVKRPVGLIHHAGLGQRDVQDRPHVAQLVRLNVPCIPSFPPPCLLASLGAEELRIGGACSGSTDGVVGLCVHAGGLVWWLEICPSVSPRRMNSDKPGRTQGHGRKPQLEAEQSGVQRPGEDRGRQPSPLGPDWMPLCVGKRRTDRQISHPEPPNAQAGSPPHQRHARSFPAERSIAAPRRTSTSAAQD